MATQAQILANRRNAAKSTGPRTAEGKAAAAKNATKHGLFARYDVVISENQAAFDALREDMLAELAPEGVMESVLAARIVSLTWRLKRAERMQNELIDLKIRREINDTFPELSESLITGKPCDLSKYSDKCYDDLALGYVAMCDFGGSRALERLSMYERRLESSLFRTKAELEKLRRVRQSEDNEENSAVPSAPRGQDARLTRGRDARDTECAKQSQFATDQEELSAFEKREYELLLSSAPRPNKANDLQQRMEGRGQRTESRPQRQAPQIGKPGVGVCRY